MVLRMMSGPKGEEVLEDEACLRGGFIICTLGDRGMGWKMDVREGNLVGWIHLAQVKNQCEALVCTVKNASVFNKVKVKLYLKQIVEAHKGYETSRLPHFLDNRLTDGGEVISLMCRPPFIHGKIPGTHFY
jgi:hypothetical protein